jgi:t-SNARE complex subunit (syntaxin)
MVEKEETAELTIARINSMRAELDRYAEILGDKSKTVNIAVLHYREVRADLSRIEERLGDLSSRVLELDQRVQADGQSRIRHEMRLATFEAELDRIMTRRGLVDGNP